MKSTPPILIDSLDAKYRLSEADFQKINAPIQKALQEARERVEASRSAPSDSEGASQTLPPLCNTGGKINLVLENGEIKQVMERHHSESEVCFLDWVNFTCHESSFRWGAVAVSDEQMIAEVSAQCERIFGFGITSKSEKGAFFYKTSYTLGEKFGLVCYGGQRNTVLISINGAGCTAARKDWERKLYDFLQSAAAPRITRLDLSHDDIEGNLFTMESLEKAFEDGAFNNGGRNPDIEMRGNWKNPNGKGRTIYVGSRTNGKFFRGYEKGCQLGAPNSKWIRLEVEFKSVDRVIPHESLLRPQDYFAAAYPVLANFSTRAERILTIQKTVQVSYERTKEWLKHQCGAAIHLMLQIEQSPQKVLDLIIREGKIPKGIAVPSYLTAGEFFHNLVKEPIPAGYIQETFGSY